MDKNINFKPVTMPIMIYGTEGERKYFRNLLKWKTA
jgi:hypothetical protein